jgi:hypothetical protein
LEPIGPDSAKQHIQPLGKLCVVARHAVRIDAQRQRGVAVAEPLTDSPERLAPAGSFLFFLLDGCRAVD